MASTSTSPAAPSPEEHFRRRASFLMAAAMGVGLLGLAGWQFDIRWIRHPLPFVLAMNPLSSLCFLAAGSAFFLLKHKSDNPILRSGAWMLSAIPIIIGVLRIIEIVCGLNARIDRMLFYEKFNAEAASNLSNHIALNTAFNFILIGLILLASQRPSRRTGKFIDGASLVIVLLAVFALIGHFYRVKDFFGVLSYLPVSFFTATGLLLIGLALLSENAGKGFLDVIFSRLDGGTTARILLPAAILIPFFLGYLRLFIQWEFPISAELGTSYLITGIIIVFFGLVFFTARIIDRNDARRTAAENELMAINSQLEQRIQERTIELSRNERFFRGLIENSSDAILLTDKNLHVIFQSPGAERMTGISLERRKANPGLRYTHPDELEIISDAQQKALANPNIPIPFQSRFLHLNGNYIWIEGVMTNLLDDEDVRAIAFNYRDVTERKRVEEGRDLFVSMVNLSDDAILSMTPDGTITTWNQGAEKLYGYPASEAIGQSIFFIIPEYLRKDEDRIFKEALKDGFVEHYETQRKTKSGRHFFISLTVSPIKGTRGKIAGISEIGHDITGRKQAEEKIASSEKRFRALIENISDAIVLNDADSNVLYQSPSVTRILGYTAGERIGATVLSFVHPDDRTAFSDLYAKLREQPGHSFAFQYQFRHKAGHYIWLEGFVTNLLNDPNVGAYVANYRDITERKEYERNILASENRFRALIENSGEGVVLINAQSEVIYRSPAALRFGGVGASRTSAGPNAEEHTDLEMMGLKFKQAFQSPGESIPFQGRFKHEDGHFFWAEGTLTNLLNVPGVNAIVTNFRDISERKKAEQLVLSLNAELEEKVIQRTSQLQIVNKELEAFTYSVSHDLRAPLRIINGFSEILIEDHQAALDEKGKKTLGVIVRNAKKMGQLIDDLLEFSRVGRTALRISAMDMRLMVEEVLQDMQSGDIHMPADITILPMPHANGDPNLMKMVWTNLLSNAVKYSGKAENPKIEIGAAIHDGVTEYFITDNGAGFDMLYADKLFGVFQRLHKQEEFPGTGVGLALVQRIVNRHGGSIRAEGQLEKGATFYFTLPLADDK